MIGTFILVYGIAMSWVWINRRVSTFRTRSPLIIMVGFGLMMADSILNTVWMTRPENEYSPFALQCDLGIMMTVFIFFGIMSIYFARMWRVYKVFGLYQEFLDM